jgi:hypothetical protein
MTAETVARIELVEAMARGMALREWPDECTMSDAALFEATQAHIFAAQAALAAIEARGCVVAPVEPTEAMIEAGWAESAYSDGLVPGVYRAMLAASPKYGRGE